jgi:HEAT repeat protein
MSDDVGCEYLRLRRARRHGDIAALVAALEDPVWAATASRFLGQTEAKEAAPAIAQLLQSSEPYIRTAAVAALGELGMRDDAGGVERLARSDSNQAVRSFALVALAQILGPEARGVIGSALENDPDWRTQRAATVALGLVGTREDLETLDDAAAREPWLKRRRYRQARRQIRRRNRRAAV